MIFQLMSRRHVMSQMKVWQYLGQFIQAICTETVVGGQNMYAQSLSEYLALIAPS